MVVVVEKTALLQKMEDILLIVWLVAVPVRVLKKIVSNPVII